MAISFGSHAVDSTGTRGSSCSVADLDGKPAIAYHVLSNESVAAVAASHLFEGPDNNSDAFCLTAKTAGVSGNNIRALLTRIVSIVGVKASISLPHGSNLDAVTITARVSGDIGNTYRVRLTLLGLYYYITITNDAGILEVLDNGGAGFNDVALLVAAINSQSVLVTAEIDDSGDMPDVTDGFVPLIGGVDEEGSIRVDISNGVSSESFSNNGLGYFSASELVAAINASGSGSALVTASIDGSGDLPEPSYSYVYLTGGANAYMAGVGSLYFARATIADPSLPSHWVIIKIDVSLNGGVGLPCSLAVLNGKPCIAYRSMRNGHLKFALANTATPTQTSDFDKVYEVDSTANAASSISMAIVDGKPHIAYWDEASLTLRYAYASNNNPSLSDWVSHVVYGPGKPTDFRGRFVKLRAGSVPVLLAVGVGKLYHFKASDATPTSSSDWTIHQLSSSTMNIGSAVAEGLVASKYAGCFRDITSNNLMYFRATSSNPTAASDWTSHVVDSDNDVGEFADIIEFDTAPAVPGVAYCDKSSGAECLKFAYSGIAEPSLTTDWTIVTVESAKVRCVSCALVANQIVIAYFDITSWDLRCVVGVVT